MKKIEIKILKKNIDQQLLVQWKKTARKQGVKRLLIFYNLDRDTYFAAYVFPKENTKNIIQKKLSNGISFVLLDSIYIRRPLLKK